ncbi:hypothetical protein HHX47_DHR1000363, partial [Lentinula edodes]
LLDSARPTSFYARLRRCGSAKSDSGLVYRTRSLFCFHGDYFIPLELCLPFGILFRFQRIHRKCGFLPSV